LVEWLPPDQPADEQAERKSGRGKPDRNKKQSEKDVLRADVVVPERPSFVLHEGDDLPRWLSEAFEHERRGQREPSVPTWTIILVMTETLPLSVVKARLSELVDRVESEDDRIIVTRNGRPAAVLVSADDLESLEETLAVLSDRELMRRIREGERAADRGDAVTLDELKRRYSRGG
jgi:antitoxin YefM